MSHFGDDGSTPFPDRTISTSGRHSRPRPVPRSRYVPFVLMMVIVAGFAVFWGVRSTVELTYRAGIAGTPGQLAGVTCVDLGGKNGTRCHGRFRSADGLRVVSDAVVDGPAPAATSAARLHADGTTVSAVGRQGVAYALAKVLACLGALIFAAAIAVAVMTRRRRPRRWPLAVTAVPLLAALVVWIFGLAAG
jgi:hypothetical protein